MHFCGNRREDTVIQREFAVAAAGVDNDCGIVGLRRDIPDVKLRCRSNAYARCLATDSGAAICLEAGKDIRCDRRNNVQRIERGSLANRAAEAHATRTRPKGQRLQRRTRFGVHCSEQENIPSGGARIDPDMVSQRDLANCRNIATQALRRDAGAAELTADGSNVAPQDGPVGARRAQCN